MRYLFATALALGLFACNQASDAGNAVVKTPDEINATGAVSNSSLTNNPATADTPLNPDEAAVMQFEEQSFDFGSIKEGEKVEHVFKFKNTGKNPLIIQSARGSCGCTVPEYPREPIPPGGTGQMLVKFDSEGKKGNQEKHVTITANTIPAESRISIKAAVIDK